MLRKLSPFAIAASLFVVTEGRAHAQAAPPPERDSTWGGVTDATAVAALGAAILMPRVFYPEPEVTVGWRARWHVSALAPVMTYATLSLVNENFLKDRVQSPRPDCEDKDVGIPGCGTYGGPSSHGFAAGAAFGHGLAVFLVDTIKWSDGRPNAIGAIGNIGIPLILSGITVVGRSEGNYESGGQIIAGATMGLGVGALLGMTYALMQRPECGYSGAMICW